METQITNIKRTKQGRYALFCPCGFLFSVGESVLLDEGVAVGDVYSEDALARLRSKSDLRRAKDKALELLSLRSHGSTELLKKLTRFFDEDTAKEAVQNMTDLQLLDDEAFATSRAAYYTKTKGYSISQARAKMRALGLERELVDAALEDHKENDGQTALAITRKHYTAKLARGESEKVKAALARRGFAFADIRAAVSQVLAELGEESGEDTDYYFDA